MSWANLLLVRDTEDEIGGGCSAKSIVEMFVPAAEVARGLYSDCPYTDFCAICRN